MKSRWIHQIALFLALALVLGPTSVLGQTTGAYYWWWTVTDERGEVYTGQNVSCSIFRSNTHAATVLHTSSTLTAGGNSPLFSDVNGKLHFYANFSTPIDLTCYYANGGSAMINGFRQGDHKIQVPRQQSMKISRFSVNNTSTATNQSSGITMPQGAVIRDVIIQNLNPDGRTTTYHISVGFAGNHAVSANVDALVSIQALTSPDEWLRPHVVAGTAGAVAGLLAAGNHRGAALSTFHTQVYAGASGTGISLYRERPYLVHVASGLDITYAVNVPGIINNSGARVHVYILWEKMHTGINRSGLTN